MVVNWAAVAAVAVVIQTAVIVLALVFGLRQARASIAHQRLEGLNRVHTDLSESRTVRRWAYNELPEHPGDLDQEQWNQLGDLVTLFDRIGSLYKTGLVDRDALLESHGLAIAQLWHHVRPYISYWRNEPGSERVVWLFEELAEAALSSLDERDAKSLQVWAERRRTSGDMEHRSA